MSSGEVWGWVPLVGGFILAAALLFAMLRNRGSKREVERTEEATRRNYAEQDADDRARDEGRL